MKKVGIVGMLVMMLGLSAVARAADQAASMTHCTMTFTLRGWSVFYKTAEGSGRVSCSNGQHADVHIALTGGGPLRKAIKQRDHFIRELRAYDENDVVLILSLRIQTKNS